MSLLPLAPPSSQRTHPSPPVLLEPVLCPGADEDAGTPVPMCMYPQPAVPDATWKSSRRSGLLPTLPRAAGFAFTSPGENLAGPVTSIASLGSLLCRGAGRFFGAADVGPGCH